ncbi:plakophilin-1 [Leuresthes tenuis]|uniref:plakophilin-1 n=1 Tax=Leuresthes tenuis TaxID=355514 RepID=UPI003B502FEB
MTSLGPLKSAISIGNVDDTSLAVPSVNQYRSGQQRVLEQVQTIRRKSTKSSSRSGSTSLSPTSPSYDSVFVDFGRTHSSTSKGSGFFGNGSSKNLILEKNIHRQMVNNSKRSTAFRNTLTSTSRHERSYAPVSSMAVGQLDTSRSEPDLIWQRSMHKRSVPAQKTSSNKGNFMTQRSTSQYVVSTTSKPQQLYAANGQIKSNKQFICSQTDMSKADSKHSITEAKFMGKGNSGTNGTSLDITLREAVEFLSSGDENYQLCGASYIQHNSFINDKAKEEVLKLNGIPLLVGLLRSSSSQVSHTASAALRNLSFKSDGNKEEIHRCGGITEALDQLRDSDSVELHKQLTGLLWNLSSADKLRSDLLKNALPVLTERVILPYTAGSNPTSGTNKDPDVFFHTTGCLRNLSSAQQSSRQTMRKCRGLIDSLVSYVKDCVDAGKPDDESVENCVCILHNLTFQLEAEAPTLFSRITALSKTVNRSHSQSNSSPVGCFSSQSKSPEHERHFDFPVVEDPQPNGVGWLIHSNTLQSYLSLLGSSQREETQEACCGTLQNLTASEGIVSSVMSQIIVQKLNGLSVISPLLKSDKANLQKSTVALVGNLTKNPNLHSAIGRKAFPELLGLLSKGTKGCNESDDTLAMTCRTASCLLMKEPEISKQFLNSNLIKSLNDLSQNFYFPKSSKAASLLLYKIWSEKDLQSFLKKQGMSKSSFVNETTMAVQRSLQIVD